MLSIVITISQSCSIVTILHSSIMTHSMATKIKQLLKLTYISVEHQRVM